MACVKRLTPENCHTFHEHWKEMNYPVNLLCICPPNKLVDKPIRLVIHTDVPHIRVQEEAVNGN